MKGKAQVVNTFTGEVIEVDWSSAEQLRDAFKQAKAFEEALKRMRAKIAESVDALIGDDEQYDFGDGFKFMRIQSNTYRYPREVVAQYLDEDQLALVTEVNPRKLKDLVVQLVKEHQIEDGVWKSIEAGAEVTPKRPYVKLEKAQLS